jgi:uncharacterized protein YdeI (YjbR/CyaY-like superfamily)
LSRVITDVGDYFTKGCGRCPRFATADCSTQVWAPVLASLRELCLEAGLSETVKWGHPCYMHAGRNVAILGALRGEARLSFFHAALLADPEGVLEKPGPNTRHPDTLRITSAARLTAVRGTLQRMLRDAMAHAEAGRTVKRETTTLVLPQELSEALAADAELAAAFAKLTPGRQRSYVINLSGAKKPETRRARVAGFRAKILAGKGALDR